jgi:hypothetical protein
MSEIDVRTTYIYLFKYTGNITFNTNAIPSGNGIHGNLVVTNNYDYNLDTTDTLGNKPWLVKDKIKDILIF